MKFPIDPRQFSDMHRLVSESRKYGDVVPKDAGRILPLIRAAMKNPPSPQQLEAMREQARWASEAAKGIDPATFKTLGEAASSGAVSKNARLLRDLLGSDGLAAANLLTNRRVGSRLQTLSIEEAEQREDRVKELSPEAIRSVEALAASPMVRQLLKGVDAAGLVEEAEAALEEGLPLNMDTEEPGDVERYGIHFDSSNLLALAVILYVALQGAAEVAPEQVFALQQALDDLAALLAVVLAVREFSASPVSERTDRESTAPAVLLIEELLAEDPGYDQDTWPEIAAALDRDRPSGRKLFTD